MRNSRLSRLAVLLVCGFLGWLAYLVGPNLEWQPTLQSIVQSTQGPLGGMAAMAVAATAVLMLVFGDGNGGIRKLAQSVCGLFVDLARWVMGASREPTVPAYPWVGSNGVLHLAEGLYHLEFRATPMARAAFSRPDCTPLPTLPAECEQPLSERPGSTYDISGDKPRWRPLRVFGRGDKVYIRFEGRALRYELPQLHVKGPAGQYRVVPYRIEGACGVVDQLFDVAELRLRGRREYVVRLKSQG